MGAFDELQQAIDTVRREKAGLDDRYDTQRAEIVSQYQLSETPEEKQMLSRLLDRLETERETATEQLRQGYNQARTEVLERVKSATGAGQQEVQELASGFERAYTQVAAEEEAAAQRYSRAGIPVNVGGAPDTGIQEALAGSAAAMGEAAAGRNAITQEDIAWLADSLLGERQASIADAGRIATRVGGAAESEHNRTVMSRIAQERAQRSAALQSLTARFDDRRDALTGREGDLLGQLAQMREQRRQFEAQLAEQQAARRAAAARASRSSGGGGRSSGGGRGGPTAAGTGVNPDDLNDAVMAIRDAERRESVKGVNLSPGYGGLPRNVGVRGGQGYLAGSRYSGGSNWDPRQNTPRGR